MTRWIVALASCAMLGCDANVAPPSALAAEGKADDVTGTERTHLYLGQGANRARAALVAMHADLENRLIVDDAGAVWFSREGLTLNEDSDAALTLVDALTRGGRPRSPVKRKFLLEITDVATVVQRYDGKLGTAGTSIQRDLTHDAHGIENVSITPNLNAFNNATAGFLPRDGFDGQVVLGTGDWLTVDKQDVQPISNILFHELAESFHRTVDEMPYATHMEGELAVGGAHEAAIVDAERFAAQLGVAGEIGGYQQPSRGK